MTLLSDDPTLLAGGLVLVAGAFLVALHITQRGKHLVYASVALGLAVIVLVTEWLWVTDRERIEEVVYDLRQAVLRSDAEGVLAHMTPTVQYLQGDVALSEETTRDLIRANLSHARFDFIRISDLQISVGQQSRRGKAEFRAFTRGSFRTAVVSVDDSTAVSSWSLGFEETEPGVWKVNRISPVSAPVGLLALPGGMPRFDDSESAPPLSGHSGTLAQKRGLPRIVGPARARKQLGPPAVLPRSE
jgi:ketosteroid isomerase-like protein